MSTQGHDFELGVSLHRLRRELATVPAVGQREARRMVQAMEREYKRHEQVAASSAKRASAATGSMWTSAAAGATATAAAIAAAGAAYLRMVRDVTAARMSVVDLHESTGHSTEMLSSLGVVATLSGRKLQQLVPKGLAAKIREAADETSEAAEAFEVLGVSREALASGDLDRVLRETVSGLQGMERGAQRTALQTQLLGREGRELMAALGGGTLEEAAAKTAELGMTMDAEAVAATVRLNDEFSNLSLAWELGSQRMADGLTDVLIPAIRLAGTAVVGLSTLIGSWLEQVTESPAKLVIPFWAIRDASRDASAAISSWQSATESGERATQDAAAALQQHRERQEAMSQARETARQRARRLREEEQAAARAARDWARAQAEAQRALEQRVSGQLDAISRLRQMVRDAESDTLSAEDRIIQAYRARMDQIDDLEAQGEAAANADRARKAAELRMQRELLALAKERSLAEAESLRDIAQASAEALDGFHRLADEVQRRWDDVVEQRAQRMQAAADQSMALASTIASAIAEVHRDQIRDIQTEARERDAAFKAARKGERERIDDLLERGEISEGEHARELVRLKNETKAKRDAHRAQQREARRAMRRGFRAQKAAQRSQAIIDAGRAVLSLIPAFAYLGPLAGGAAATAVGVQLGMELRRIDRQQPPEFSGGGAVAARVRTSADHVPISARLDEGIVSPRGMAQIGPDGLDAINRGEPVSRETRLYLDGRVIAEAAERAGVAHLRPQQGRIAGRAPVYGRG